MAMNPHRLIQPHERPGLLPRFYAPGETILLAPGSYVSCVGIDDNSTYRILNMLYGIGVLSDADYGAEMRLVDGHRNDPEWLDGTQLEMLDKLNAAAEDGHWAFENGDLTYIDPATEEAP